ncbi:protein kinase domain-containing protein [Planctomicrobium sp. SH664]|uniref:serine/threonine protein kinase n=1 Tax=Planctomicrobium sp. SH664 TaxID=3448125 RepID=UPI003F5AE126
MSPADEHHPAPGSGPAAALESTARSTLESHLALVEQLDPDSPIAIEELAAEFIDRCQSGERPSIQQYMRDYPELAGAIEELFPTIAKLEGLKQVPGSSGGRAVTGLPFLKRLGDFRILREVGRGGMGVVFEAEQLSLHRRVALKVLGANVARSEQQRERFKREAESAARLHHTNIVPVFGIGEEHGVQYYAMQYINGWSLSEIIAQLAARQRGEDQEDPGGESPRLAETAADLPGSDHAHPVRTRFVWEEPVDSVPAQVVVSPLEEVDSVRRSIDRDLWRNFRFCAKLIGDLADAVAYAHAHGVLHRDLKPANVIVDREGVAWLVDFGLAKQQDYEDLTLSGDAFGTVRYMAPEQCNGQADQRSDIYSLALVLYELLCLVPAYPESQPGQLISRKSSQRPASPRSICADIPRNLETIVMKACAIDPAERYQTASEFAEDLRLFVEDRPIRARRESVFERLRSWSRRNPLIAGLACLSIVLSVTVIGLVEISYQRTRAALAQVEQQKYRAERNLVMSVEALENIMESISRRGIPRTLRVGLDEGEARVDDVAVTPADAELLESLLQFYDQFAAQNDTSLASQTALALSRIGDIETRLGHIDRATSAYQKAIERYSQLLKSTPQDANGISSLANTLNQLGVAQSQGGRVVEAGRSHEQARRLLEGLEASMHSDAVKFELAETLLLLSTIGHRAGGREIVDGIRAANEIPESASNSEAAAGEDRESEFSSDDLVRSGSWRSGLSVPTLHAPIDQAAQLLVDLHARNPQNADYRLALAKCLLVQWRNRNSTAHPLPTESSAQLHVDGMAMLRELVAEYPDSPRFTYELADALCEAALAPIVAAGRNCEEELREAHSLAERLTVNSPRNSDYQALLARTIKGTAVLADRRRDTAAASANYARALAIQQRLAQENPSVMFFQISVAQLLAEIAAWEKRQGNQAAAAANYAKAIAVLEASSSVCEENWLFEKFLRHLRKQQEKS